MMSHPQDEPTMEEILASIRRIIAEEEPEGTPSSDSRTEEKSASASPPLTPPSLEGMASKNTGQVAGAGSSQGAMMENNNDMKKDDILLLTRMLGEDGNIMDLSSSSAEKDDPLISGHTAYESSQAFVALANALVRENIHRGRTLEDLIMDIMRPLLKEWLDNNLSAMVEKIIQEEVEKIANRTQH